MKTKNIGYNNEFEFCDYLNGKMICDLSPLFQKFIIDLYGNLNDNYKIKSFVDYNKRKYDIVIIINNIYKRVSIKMGIKNSMHCEKISSFINFLVENKVNKDIIIKYLKYHYGDGTINGSGKNRLSVSEYKKLYQKDIDEINENINNIQLLKKATERFVLVGTSSKYSIDCIIHGTIHDFIWLKKQDIEKLIISYVNCYSTGVHFGPLSVQSHNRCLNKNLKYEYQRFYVQIKWYNLRDDITNFINNRQ